MFVSTYCSVFGGDIKGVDCGDETAAWLRKFLKKEDEDFRLLQYAPGIKMRNCADELVGTYQTVAKETDNVNMLNNIENGEIF